MMRFLMKKLNSPSRILFNVNVPTRVGFQTPFTNLTMDLTVAPHYKDQPAIIGGKLMDKKFGDFQLEMDMLNQAF